MNSTLTKPKSCLKKTRRRSAAHAVCRGERSNNVNAKGELSDKLEALKKLIPTTHHDDNGKQTVKADDLFQETADYIVLLKTQVVVLQKLIDFYGPKRDDDEQNQCVSS